MSDNLLSPESLLDFEFDWTDQGEDPWLAEGETIVSYEVAPVPPGSITVADKSEVGGVITYWLTGGVVGTEVKMKCSIETSAGRKDNRSTVVRIAER